RIDHRLLRCSSEVDDAQSAVTERDAILHERAAGVRPARMHPLRHGCNAAAGGAPIEGHFTANATHFLFVRKQSPCGSPSLAPHSITLTMRRRFHLWGDGLEKPHQTRMLRCATGFGAEVKKMGARDGKSYVARLKAHPRDVWVAGRKVDDVTTDPVFRRPV